MKFRDSHSQATAELELAPMIDVVFLLLLFFVTAWASSTNERDMTISVPAAEQNAQNPNKDPYEIIINVTKEGEVKLNNGLVALDDLLGRLQAIQKINPNQSVILRGDAFAEFQHVINVMDVIKKAGIWNVAFATMRPQEAPASRQPQP